MESPRNFTAENWKESPLRHHNMKLATARIPIAGKPLSRFPNIGPHTTKSFFTPLTYRQKYNWNGNHGSNKSYNTPTLPLNLKTFHNELTNKKSGQEGLKLVCLGAALLVASAEDREREKHQEKFQVPRMEKYEEPERVGSPLNFKDLLVHSSMGTVVGFAVGYAARKSLKLLFVLLGGQFIMLQILQHMGYIEIKWGKVTEKVEEKWTHERSKMWNTAKAILTENVPFKGGFLAGMAWGFHFPV